VAVITITGEKGTGSRQLISQLAEKLDYDFIGEDFQHEIARELKLSEGEVEMFKKASQSRLIRKMDRFTCTLVQKVVDRERGCLDDRDFYEATVKLVEKLHADDNVIIHNWGAQCILNGKPNTVHVRLTRTREKKIEEAMKAFDLNFSAARKVVVDDEQDLEAYIKQFFGAELNDARLYDLVIDTGKTDSARAIGMIVDQLKHTGG